MSASGRSRLFCLALLALAAVPLHAQGEIKVSTLVLTFLPAATNRATLPWSTGSGSAIKWQTSGPVNPDADGYTKGRIGQARALLEGHDPIPVTVNALGNNAGIQRVTMSFDWPQPDYDLLERALATEGVVLAPFRCSRATEPRTGGNVIFETSAPNKRSVGLAEAWACADGTGCSLELAILYRRSDVTSIHCLAGQ